MKRKEVLIVGPNVDMIIHGGIVTHMKLLLSFANDKDYDFNLQAFTLGERKVVGEKITMYKLLTSYLEYIWKLLTKKIKIVHINSSMKNGSIIKNFFVLLISKIFLKKCIFQFHGGSPDDISRHFIFILKFIISLADKILVLTDDQMNIKHYLNESEWTKIEKIPNYIKIRNVNLSNRKHDTKVHFLFVGRVIKEKGIYEIIKAAKKLIDNDLDFQVDIMGDGSDLKEMKQVVNKLELQRYFQFHGFVTNDVKKDNLYSTSNIMIFPSYYKEGFPYTILEAMLFKMPIVSTKAGALADVIEDNKNGFLIPFQNHEILAEKMKYFILNLKDIERMGSHSLSLINTKYSTEIMKQKLTNIYQELI